jgi:hypothetical protein
MHIYNTPGTDVNGRNVEEHLRYQYKRFVKETKRNLRYKPVRWIGFPTAFEDFDTTEMVAPYWPRNAPPRRQAVTRLRACRTATFYATLDTLDYDQRRGGYYYGYNRGYARGMLLHNFVAPYEPRNADLLLAPGLTLFMRGPEAYVLLDTCLEQGCTPSADYEIISSSRYIRVESEKMRLLLYENITKTTPFDIVFEVGVQMAAPFNFNLEAQ